MCPVIQLPHMVSRLVDTSTTFSPPHPCSVPALLQPEDLDAWDCSAQMLHVQRLLQLACCVTVMAQYHVAGFLRQVVASTNKDSGQQYVAILPSCACEECAHVLSGLRHGGRVGMPCRASQVLAKFARDSLANFTPTFFRQCVQMHANLPPLPHDLFTSSVETATVTPTHA